MEPLTVLQAGIPHDPASIFALVLTVAVAAMLYFTSRPKDHDGDDSDGSTSSEGRRR